MPDLPPEGYVLAEPVRAGSETSLWRCLTSGGETCVVKASPRTTVSQPSLEALTRTRCPNVASPRRVWRQADTVYEELPEVDGVPLRAIVAPGIGGLGGSVITGFRSQLSQALHALHATGLAHRDVRARNVMAILRPHGSGNGPRAWSLAPFGRGATSFALGWVLLDCSAVAAASADTRAGDLAQLERTTAFALTGRAWPAAPVDPRRYAEHGYCGTLQLAPDSFVICAAEPARTELAGGDRALAIHRELEAVTSGARRHEHRYWIKRLSRLT